MSSMISLFIHTYSPYVPSTFGTYKLLCLYMSCQLTWWITWSLYFISRCYTCHLIYRFRQFPLVLVLLSSFGYTSFLFPWFSIFKPLYSLSNLLLSELPGCISGFATSPVTFQCVSFRFPYSQPASYVHSTCCFPRFSKILKTRSTVILTIIDFSETYPLLALGCKFLIHVSFCYLPFSVYPPVFLPSFSWHTGFPRPCCC